MNCRHCGTPLTHSLVDLGMHPLCQDHVQPHELEEMEPFYPLHAMVCHTCFLVQLNVTVSPTKIFDAEYGYFSSFSDSWLRHAKAYTELVTERFGLTDQSLVVELASNDGYLLQYFREKNVPVLGVEPSANVAEAARKKGIRTEIRFFGTQTAHALAEQYGQADLLLGNNVLAHVPDINDFVAGMKHMLKPTGVLTMEFPHLQRLIEENQFDTIYHEHFSYLSFGTVERIFAHHGLRLFDVQELPTHGGSLRIYGCHPDNANQPTTDNVTQLRVREQQLGFQDVNFYANFGEKVRETKRKLLDFLIEAKRAGKQVVGYGAPGKGNTLLNYCGIRTDFLDYTVDRSPHKQGNFLPGTRIPILDPSRIAETRPDYVLILPWNLRKEISEQMAHIRTWGGKFVVPIPEAKIYE